MKITNIQQILSVNLLYTKLLTLVYVENCSLENGKTILEYLLIYDVGLSSRTKQWRILYNGFWISRKYVYLFYKLLVWYSYLVLIATFNKCLDSFKLLLKTFLF